MSFFSLGIPPSLDDHTSKISIAVQMRPTLTQVKQLLRSGPVRQQIYLGIGSATRAAPATRNGGYRWAIKKCSSGTVAELLCWRDKGSKSNGEAAASILPGEDGILRAFLDVAQ
jgi:hypothetical protein